MTTLQEALKRTKLREKIQVRKCEDGCFESTIPGIDHESFGESEEIARTNLIITLHDMQQINKPEAFKSLFENSALLEEVLDEISNFPKTRQIFS